MIKSIWAIGRNYDEHAKEMGQAPSERGGDPIVFLKAAATVVPNGRAIRLPTWSENVQHEVEIAVRLGATTEGLQIDAVTIALDLTARDVQARLKEKSLPWTLAKSFVDSCPIGDWVPASRLGKTPADIFRRLQELEFNLKVDGEIRQSGSAREMIFSVQEICDYLQSRFPLQEGDVILTGTPAGVGPVRPGQYLEAEITDLTRASWTTS